MLSAAQGNYTGIFATHQHSLFDDRLGLLPQLHHCHPCRMLTDGDSLGDSEAPAASQAPDLQGKVPLFKVAPGVSCESMAFQVALDEVSIPGCQQTPAAGATTLAQCSCWQCCAQCMRATVRNIAHYLAQAMLVNWPVLPHLTDCRVSAGA